MFFNKLKAISYVEVLLTLVIVGVISSIAIPTLKKYSQREELGRQAQKAYLTLNEALDMSIIDNGPAYKWKAGNNFNTYIKPYLKISKDNYNMSSRTWSVTKDNMCVCVLANGSGFDYIILDVNADKGPNVNGKDRFYFKMDYTNSKVEPNEENTKKLFQNNWKFTDELWNK